MTTRTVRTERPGPALIRTNLPSHNLTVIAEPGRTHAELTISTKDDTGPSADAVNNATLTATGLHLECRMQRGGVGGGGTVIQTGRGGVMQINSGGGIFKDYQGGSVLSRRGRLVVTGPWTLLRQFLTAFAALEETSE